MKPLIFAQTEVDSRGKRLKTWELIAVGDSPIMHAMWSPEHKTLVCQFNSAKESFRAIPKQTNSGKIVAEQRKVEEYYKVMLTDVDAIQAILDNFVVNYTNQEWNIEAPMSDGLMNTLETDPDEDEDEDVGSDAEMIASVGDTIKED